MELEHYSSPQKPPRHGIQVSGEDFFYHFATRTAYAAHHILNQLTAHGKTNQTSPTTMTVTTDYAEITIRSDSLEDLIEYQPTSQESTWTPQAPLSSHLRKINRALTSSASDYTEQQSNVTTSPKQVSEPKQQFYPRHKAQKHHKDMITVAEIAQSLNVQPNKARNILRKASIQKPQQGWVFSPDDHLIERITQLLKSSS